MSFVNKIPAELSIKGTQTSKDMANGHAATGGRPCQGSTEVQGQKLG